MKKQVDRRITKVIVVFQRYARPRERSKVVGFREGIKFKNFEKEIEVDIPVGPGCRGTTVLAHVIARMVNRYRRKDSEYYYVKVEEERRVREGRKVRTVSVFRTVMPRTRIPIVQVRHV